MKKHPHSGFTLLELMATISIIAILAAIAVPSFTSTLEKRRIVGAAEQLQSDLRWARAEAIKSNKRVCLILTTGDAWTYAVWRNTKDDESKCPFTSGEKLKFVNGADKSIDKPIPSYSGTSLASNFQYSTFDPTSGRNPNNGTATFTTNDLNLSVVASFLGRAHICGNTGGYKKCPPKDS